MTLSPPPISVIIPTFNRSETLLRAVNSVINQDYEGDIELIIIDDASTDSTEDLIKGYTLQHANIQYHKLSENRGVSAARNYGIKTSQHAWIAFLDSDDAWLPNKLSLQIKHQVHNGNNLKVIHGEELWIRNGKPLKQLKKHKKYGGRIFTHCLPLCLMSPSTILIHRSVFNDVGLFNEDYPVCEDYDLWLKITAKYEVGFVEDPIIYKYGGHADQLSHKYHSMDYWRIKSLAQIFNSKDITYEEQQAVLQEIEKKGPILLKGYLKHDNLKNYDEIESILKSLR